MDEQRGGMWMVWAGLCGMQAMRGVYCIVDLACDGCRLALLLSLSLPPALPPSIPPLFDGWVHSFVYCSLSDGMAGWPQWPECTQRMDACEQTRLEGGWCDVHCMSVCLHLFVTDYNCVNEPLLHCHCWLGSIALLARGVGGSYERADYFHVINRCADRQTDRQTGLSGRNATLMDGWMCEWLSWLTTQRSIIWLGGVSASGRQSTHLIMYPKLKLDKVSASGRTHINTHT